MRIPHSFNIIEAEAGGQFTIEIFSNASTGYGWMMVRPPDGDVARFVSEEVVFDDVEGEELLVGQGGTLRMVFDAVREGETLIVLHYLQGWVNEPIQTASYRVIVD